MRVRIGKVTNVYPETGKVKVLYEDEKCASMQLPLLTLNQEYSMPKVEDRVLVIHMENGGSKGFVLGTYYNENRQPKATSGYRKDFEEGAYVTCNNGIYRLKASEVIIECSYGSFSAEEVMKRLERIEDALGLPHTI